MERAARDVIIRAELAKEAHPGCPLYVYGHSMGGLIAALVACNEPHLMDGLILEAAAFQIHPKTGKWYLILGAKILNWIMPSIKVGGLEFWSISRKKSVCDNKEQIYPLYGDVAMSWFGNRINRYFLFVRLPNLEIRRHDGRIRRAHDQHAE